MRILVRILVRLYSLSELPRGPRDRIDFIQLSPHSVDMTVVASSLYKIHPIWG